MGIMQHSSSKKIDVDELKGKLAESVRKGSDKYSADITLKKGYAAGGGMKKRGSNSDLMGVDFGGANA